MNKAAKREVAVLKAMERLEQTEYLPAEKRKALDMTSLQMLYNDGYDDAWEKAFPLLEEKSNIIAETAVMDLRVEEACHPDEVGEKVIERGSSYEEE